MGITMIETYFHSYPSVLGQILIGESGGYITSLHQYTDDPDDAIDRETEVLVRAYTQLQEYFAGERKTFDLPVRLSGTPFQQSVWQALQRIPYGETRSYRDIAEAIGNPKAVRAVGSANNRNPLFIIIPCHRVIGSDGSLVGYGGGLAMKQFLLDLEARNSY